MFLEYYFYYFYYLLLGYPFIIRLAIIVVGCLFIPVFILACTRLTHFRREYYLKKKIKKKCRARHFDKIKEIISSKEIYSAQQIASELNCNAGKLSKRQKRVLTNQILEAHNTVDTLNRINYRRIVEYFNLRDFWERKLKYGSLSARHKALRKLDDLDIEVPGSVITQLTHSRNEHLRKRARTYYTYFSKINPFKFLESDYDTAFNEWDKIEIHNVLKRKEHEGLPVINQWLRNSENTSFRCFLIDEIIHFNQKSCCPYLRELLKTEDLRLRKHCIDALGVMRCFDSEEDLMSDYAMQPVIIQRSIVKALQRICSGKALPFLEEAYLSAHDSETRIIILQAIYNYGEAGRKLFYVLKNAGSPAMEVIFNHVSNPLIKVY